MAETIDISAVARVIDLASPALKAIAGVITSVGDAAKQTTSVVAGMSRNMAGTVGQMVGGLGRAGDQVAGFGKKIAGMFGPLSGLAGVASLGGITAAITSFVNESMKLDAAAQALRITAATLEALQEVSDAPEKVTASLTHLQTAMAELKKGGPDVDHLGSLLHRMGVTAEEIAKGDLAAVLPKIADSLKKNAGNALEAQVGLALWGENWKEMIPLLSQGKEGLAAAAAAMQEFGLASSMPEAKEADKALKALGKTVTNIKNTIAAAVLPAFIPMVNAVRDFVAANKELLKQVALPFFLGSLATALISLGVAVAGVLGPWGLLVGAIVAGAAAIYQNWDKVKAFFDETLPGFLPALVAAGQGIASWAKQASADITKGFQTGGIAGGLQAIWQVFKSGWTDSIAWLTTQFAGINWGAVGTSAANLMSQAMVAVFNAQVSLGQLILDSVNSVDWTKLGVAILNGIGSMYSKAGDLLAGLRGLDWQSVGAFIGKVLVDAIILSFEAYFNINALLTRIFAGADWSAIGIGLLKYLTALPQTMVSIGADLLAGLIKGMWNAIPGIDDLVDAIKGKLKSIGDYLLNLGASIGQWAKTPLISTPGVPAPGGSPNLLSQPGAATGGVQTQRSAVDIKVTTPPGGKAEVSQTSGPPVDVNVGANLSGIVNP